MGFFDYFRANRKKQNSAAVAKERLQIIVAHERGSGRRRSPDYLPALKRELLEVVRKYVQVEQDQIKVHLDRDGDCEVLELNILLPDDEVPARPAT
ncbi:cell division topological specificity factor MinE [Plasticicumulans acidivorans]|uniref:Cell division topological specificity factor n=1 Tax=Plasticicumulans acidivorans TaxID=886464 RepID=A0A317MT44_9GAMM|nr:cell division topological specificity factor MinE [Plasticicumulans acidivorans]PWV60508.1 cell division topological specificity factor MinE [Plasticicumulans acidivorans]